MLAPLNEQEAKNYGAVEDAEGEARVFTLWLNSLRGSQPCATCSTRPSCRHLTTCSPEPSFVAAGSKHGAEEEGDNLKVEPQRPSVSRFKCVQHACLWNLGHDIVVGKKTLVLGMR